jgi:hypothetical protein
LKLLDFGMGRIIEQETSGDAAQTRSMVSAPHYVAPEYFDAEFGPIGPWSDVYSFALILLEAATGERVRKGKGYSDIAIEVIERQPVPTPRALGLSVPEILDTTFALALAHDAKQRTRDMADLWSQIRHALNIPDAVEVSGTPTFDMPPRSALPSDVKAFLEEPVPAPPPIADDEERTMMAQKVPAVSPRAAEVSTSTPAYDVSSSELIVDDPVDRTVVLPNRPPQSPQPKFTATGRTLGLDELQSAFGPPPGAAPRPPQAPPPSGPMWGNAAYAPTVPPPQQPQASVAFDTTVAAQSPSEVMPRPPLVPMMAQAQPPAPQPYPVQPSYAPPGPSQQYAAPPGPSQPYAIGPSQQYAAPDPSQQFSVPPQDMPQPAQGVSTRTLLWITLAVLVLALLGAAGIAFVLLRSR